MALGVNFPAGFNRLNPIPLDLSAVFDDLPAFQAYLAGGTAYAGQVVAVRNVGNVPALYRINEDLTYSAIGEGGGDALVFWFERDGDNLYYVTESPSLLPPPFELEDENLYYFPQRVW